MADEKKQAVALFGSSQALATQDYGADGSAGFENTTSADFKIPWLKVLDAKSKEVDSVPNAKAGLICNSVTKALFVETMFIPAITEAYYVEWKPRAQGGGGGQGFVAAHKPNSPLVVAALAELAKKGGKFAKGADGKNLLPKNGENDLVETYYVHGQQLVVETGDINRAVLAFSSTGIPVYQGWLGMAKDQKYTNKDGERVAKPLFAHAYRLGAAKTEKNGNSWWNFNIRFAGDQGAANSALDVNSSLYENSRDIVKEVLAGNAKVDHSTSGGAEAAGEKKSGDVPF